MNIHTVAPGDSLYKIAKRYGVNSDEIYELNELQNMPYLVVGQSLVIPTKETAYTVRPGDSLYSIAKKYGTSAESIARLNSIENPERITPGTILRVPTGSKNYGYIEVNAYLEPSIPQRDSILVNQVGEYLTYISPFSYQVRADGSLVSINDETILSQSKKYAIAPLMVITNFADGNFDTNIADTILYDKKIQDTLFSNVINVMRQKGYYGVNIDFERITPENRGLYNAFLKRSVEAFHKQGYVVSTALAPKPSDYETGSWHGAHDYKAHGEIVDFVIIMTYEWGWSGGPPYAVAPVDLVEDVIRYAVSVMPPKKILMGMPLYGYDWPLPFMPDGKWAKRISPQDAVKLAANKGQQIIFDSQTQSPTFKYRDENGVEHEVWFEDARSVEAKLLLVNEYGLRGVSYWVLGVSFPQNWTVLNDMYNIVKVIPQKN